jgi:hypothetical protein
LRAREDVCRIDTTMRLYTVRCVSLTSTRDQAPAKRDRARSVSTEQDVVRHEYLSTLAAEDKR